MEPYVKKKCRKVGPNRPRAEHRPGRHSLSQSEKDAMKAARRALKKAARQESKLEISKAEYESLLEKAKLLEMVMNLSPERLRQKKDSGNFGFH